MGTIGISLKSQTAVERHRMPFDAKTQLKKLHSSMCEQFVSIEAQSSNKRYPRAGLEERQEHHHSRHKRHTHTPHKCGSSSTSPNTGMFGECLS